MLSLQRCELPAHHSSQPNRPFFANFLQQENGLTNSTTTRNLAILSPTKPNLACNMGWVVRLPGLPSNKELNWEIAQTWKCCLMGPLHHHYPHQLHHPGSILINRPSFLPASQILSKGALIHVASPNGWWWLRLERGQIKLEGNKVSGPNSYTGKITIKNKEGKKIDELSLPVFLLKDQTSRVSSLKDRKLSHLQKKNGKITKKALEGSSMACLKIMYQKVWRAASVSKWHGVVCITFCLQCWFTHTEVSSANKVLSPAYALVDKRGKIDR